MRLPTRKSEKNNLTPVDVHITAAKFDELTVTLARLKKIRPRAANEVKRLAEMGDFSENAAYQIAKGRLRGINSRLSETEYALTHAVIIQPSSGAVVQLGHMVTVAVNGKEKTYRILGASETCPERGIISHNSPIGAALIGRRAGETVSVLLNGKEIVYKVVSIA